MGEDTRTRILAVAAEMFIEQGYEGTSLRVIADRLGVTKAALYYHFHSKEQILVALLEPTVDLVHELTRRLDCAEGIEGWADALAWTIGQLDASLNFFKLVQRNRTVIEKASETLDALRDHRQMVERAEQAVRAKTSDFSEQIRMIAALAAVTGFDEWAPNLLVETPPERLKAELTATVRDILRLQEAPGQLLE